MGSDEVTEPIEGEGYALGSIDGIGDGYGFRKIRRALGVTAFGINAIVIPPGYETGRHFHEEQEETYFVHRGRIEMTFGDGETYVLAEGGVARVDPATVRKIKNGGEGDAVYVVAGGREGYVGRDGRIPEGEENSRGPGFSGPPGAPPS